MVGNSMIHILDIIKDNYSTHFKEMFVENIEFINSHTFEL